MCKIMPDIARNILYNPDFRFELRPLDSSCVSGLYEAAIESKAHVAPWLPWLHANYCKQDTENWAAIVVDAWNNATKFEFVIYDREDGAVAGCCGLNNIVQEHAMCNLGYWVRASKLRQGAATQAIALIKAFAFDQLEMKRLEIVVVEENCASRGVAEKSGAIYEGLLHNRLIVDGKSRNARMYALIPSSSEP